MYILTFLEITLQWMLRYCPVLLLRLMNFNIANQDWIFRTTHSLSQCNSTCPLLPISTKYTMSVLYANIGYSNSSLVFSCCKLSHMVSLKLIKKALFAKLSKFNK